MAHLRRRPSRLPEKTVPGNRLTGHAVELRAPESIPLESEAARIVVRRNETRHGAHNGVRDPAAAAGQNSRFNVSLAVALDVDAERALTARAHEQVHQVKVHAAWCSVSGCDRRRYSGVREKPRGVTATGWVDKEG